ncbi:MAG: hypothetical protein WCC10_02830, partial [Tumebacillaceae bacterium]
RAVMPQIVQAAREARTRALPQEVREAARLMHAQVAELPHLFHLERLQGMGVLESTPLEVLRGPSNTPLRQWYSICKPVIEHFAGRAVHAEL